MVGAVRPSLPCFLPFIQNILRQPIPENSWRCKPFCCGCRCPCENKIKKFPKCNPRPLWAYLNVFGTPLNPLRDPKIDQGANLKFKFRTPFQVQEPNKFRPHTPRGKIPFPSLFVGYITNTICSNNISNYERIKTQHSHKIEITVRIA